MTIIDARFKRIPKIDSYIETAFQAFVGDIPPYDEDFEEVYVESFYGTCRMFLLALEDDGIIQFAKKGQP